MEPDRASHSRRLPPDTPTIESFNLPDNSTLKVALQPGYSIRFDDLPSRFQIRIMDRRSVSPGGTRQEPTRQRSPGATSQEPTRQRWMEDYGPPRWEDEGNRVPNLPPSEIQLPPSPSRSREQMQEELRRDMYENSDPVGFRETTCETCNTVGVDGEKIYLRKPSIQYLSMTDGRKSSQQPSASPSLSRQPSAFIDSQRPSRDFRRNNIHVTDSDIHEMHHDLTPQQTPKSMPPHESYNPEKYSSPPESPRSASPGRCSWHRQETCPVRAGYRCRENTGYESPDRGSPDSEHEDVRCTFHRQLSCPAQAGVRCRSERSVSPPLTRPGRKEEMGTSSDFLENSCKCRGAQVRRPSRDPDMPSPPGRTPSPSCHCQG